MKNLTIILIICFLFFCACTGKPKKGLNNTGKIEVENGIGQKVKISFEVVYASESEKLIPKDNLKKIINESSTTANYSCKYKPTYEPVSVSVMMKNDTITTILSFRAKNGFGVPDDLRSYSKYKGTELIESF